MRLVCIPLLVTLLLSACGGGGSSSDGVVFQGTLTERGAGHSKSLSFVQKHSAGQRIEDVKVCILGECSITDGMGQWGVQVNGFTGGNVALVLDGHGISSSVVASIPASAKEVTIDIDHADNILTIAKVDVDGEDHTGHDHSHEGHATSDHNHK